MCGERGRVMRLPRWWAAAVMFERQYGALADAVFGVPPGVEAEIKRRAREESRTLPVSYAERYLYWRREWAAGRLIVSEGV